MKTSRKNTHASAGSLTSTELVPVRRLALSRASRLHLHEVAPHEEPTDKSHGKRPAAEWGLGRARHLGVDVQVRLAAFTGIADFGDLLSDGKVVFRRYSQRSLPEMR